MKVASIKKGRNIKKMEAPENLIKKSDLLKQKYIVYDHWTNRGKKNIYPKLTNKRTAL